MCPVGTRSETALGISTDRAIASVAAHGIATPSILITRHTDIEPDGTRQRYDALNIELAIGLGVRHGSPAAGLTVGQTIWLNALAAQYTRRNACAT